MTSQDSRWQMLVACTTCNLLLQSSRQAKVFSRWAKDSCSSYLDADSEGDKIFCTTISQYSYSLTACVPGGIPALRVGEHICPLYKYGLKSVGSQTPGVKSHSKWFDSVGKERMRSWRCKRFQFVPLSPLIFRIFQNICRESCTCCDLCMTKPRFGAVDKVFAPGIMLSVFCLTRVLKLRTWVLELQMYHCCRWRMAFLRALSALRFGFQGLMPICRRFATQWGMRVYYGLLYVDIMVYSLLFLDPSVGHFIHLIFFLINMCIT